MGPMLKDASWIRHSFRIPTTPDGKPLMDMADLQQRISSSARLKFVDTTPGGNFAINPPPQFTRTADPKVRGRFSGGSGLMSYKGLGRYYSEAIDDNSQIIHMRFGVPQFNSLTTFFTGFYDTGAGQLARTGRAREGFYMLGRAAGFVVSIMSWQLLAVHALGVGARFALGAPSSKFYYLKPTMPLYWNAVQTMLNQIAVNRGIVPRMGGPDQQDINGGYVFDEAAMKKIHDLLPDVFNKNGSIDVYALANRAQRLAFADIQNQQAAADGDLSFEAMVEKFYGPVLKEKRPEYLTYLDRWFKADASDPKADEGGTATEQLTAATATDDGFFDFLKAELEDGGAFASFRVNATGQVSESFSSSTRQSDLQNKMNSMSSQSRSTMFSVAGGNLDDGIVAKAIGGVLTAAKDFAAGVATTFGVSGLAALGGGAFTDIPEHWESSTASLPTSSYTIHLTSPYGNPISQLLNLHLPLCMLLAGALPLSTGKQSYTSPFLCEIYDQGRCQSRLAIIDSLQVTRGTTSLGFNNDGNVMGIDVTFTVKDLSSIMHMPISQGFSLGRAVGTAVATGVGAAGGAVIGSAVGPAGTVAGAAAGGAAAAAAASGVFDEDTVFSDYMGVLSGLGLADQIYPWRKLKLNLTRQMTNLQTLTSPAKWASFAGDTLPARLASAVFKGTER